MIHKTPNETTANLYESDGLVSVRVLENPHRHPPHNSHNMVVFRFSPTAHTRIRDLGNGIIEFMPTHEDIGAFLEAFDKANGKYPITLKLPLVNKPIERKQYHVRQNKRRVKAHRLSQRRFYRSNRRS